MKAVTPLLASEAPTNGLLPSIQHIGLSRPPFVKWHIPTPQIVESCKCKNRQLFCYTLLLMFQTSVFSRTTIYFLLYPRHLFRFIVLCNDVPTIGSTSSKVHLLQTAAMRNARVCARIRRFSSFCLHPFTFRAYLSGNEYFAGEGFTFAEN